ncbi:Helix-turn-helix domain-containing protein [Frankineae bacterium MT45]|nr:Helix-turn-helix domain-containing protein [Frankineae bacterium MT45]
MSKWTVHIPPGPTLRIAIKSDLLGVVQTSLMELFGPLRHRSHPSVVAEATRRARGIDMEILIRTTVQLEKSGLEPFLWPSISYAEQPALDDVLDEMAATPAETIVEQFNYYPRAANSLRQRQWVESPEPTLQRYVRALRQYLGSVLRPVYPNFEARIATETRYLRDLTDRGRIDPSVVGLHPDLDLGTGTLRFSAVVGSEAAATDWSITEWSSPALLIVPMVCTASTLTYSGPNFGTTHAEQMVGLATSSLAVSGPGVSTLPRPDPLATLLGDARAAILRCLFLPSTTTDLAHELGYSPSTISHHLKALSSAQAVEGQRIRSFVYYRLTDVGQQLIQLYR